jgi:hypothetical protein
LAHCQTRIAHHFEAEGVQVVTELDANAVNGIEGFEQVSRGQFDGANAWIK